ncbi:MAG: hypothetical protein IPM35_41645 [Myxococcales bacterium]|nr:hypothetical protein [Myxococcales bacterium]
MQVGESAIALRARIEHVLQRAAGAGNGIRGVRGIAVPVEVRKLNTTVASSA